MEPVRTKADLKLIEQLFLKLWCFPPPAVPYEPRDTMDPDNPRPIANDPLAHARRVFGPGLDAAIKDRIFVDIGCGTGDQVIGAALRGARLAVGLDTKEVGLKAGETSAHAAGVADRVKLTTETLDTLGTQWADVAMSQNSFEHFQEPEKILELAYLALKPGGKFFVTFNPPWWHPFGVHHMFMIRLPWAHALFSMDTILRVRQLYRPNKPTTWRGVGLNQMTIAKFEKLLKQSGFVLESFSLEPIRPLPPRLMNLRPFREWTTSNVSAVLRKPMTCPPISVPAEG